MTKVVDTFVSRLTSLAADRAGVTVIEYGLAACLAALALVQAMGLGGK